MIRDSATYIPFIDTARTLARELRDEARYDESLALGINSDSIRDMLGLHDDAEYCYYLKTGDFMPKNQDQALVRN
jgi:hypothetical protein